MIDPHVTASARNWYAVFCKPRQDATAEQNLLNQGFETFRPKTRHRRVQRGSRRTLIESMFPRYLFVRLSRGGENWSPIRSTRGIVGLVRSGLDIPIIPDPVIAGLRERCCDEGIVNLAGAIDYRPNEVVEIVDGPCTGYRALFQARTSDERVVVLLKMLQHERRVELSDTAIRRA